MSKKHRYNDRFRQAAASAVEQTSHQQVVNHTPKIIGGVIFVSVLVGAWLLLQPTAKPQSSTPTEQSTETLEVQQGGSTNDASATSGDVLQGTEEQPLDGSSGSALQDSTGGQANPSSDANLLDRIESGDVQLNIDQSTDSDTTVEVE